MNMRDLLRRYDTKAYAVCGCQIELVYLDDFQHKQYPLWVVKDRVLCNRHKAALILAKRKYDKNEGGD